MFSKVTMVDEPKPETIRRVFTPIHQGSRVADTVAAAHEGGVIIGNLGNEFRIAIAPRHEERLQERGADHALRALNDGPQAQFIAAVQEAFEQNSEKKVVCREIFTYSFSAMPEEIAITTYLMRLRNPHIASAIDYCALANENGSNRPTINSPDGLTRTYLFFEEYLYQGQPSTLDAFIVQHPNQALRAFNQVLLGVATLHEHGIYHRDLKEDNVMMSGESPENATAVIIDLATCTKALSSQDYCGTIGYMRPETVPPELRQNPEDAYSPQASDYFALSQIAQNIESYLTELNNPELSQDIGVFNGYVRIFKERSDELQASIQARSTQPVVEDLSLPETTTESNRFFVSRSLYVQLDQLDEQRDELLQELSQQTQDKVRGGFEFVYQPMLRTLDVQLEKRKDDPTAKAELLKQQIAYIQLYITFVYHAKRCAQQQFGNDQQMSSFLRSIQRQFSLNHDVNPAQNKRLKKAIDELARVTTTLAAPNGPNQAIHQAIHRLRQKSSDPSARDKANRIAEKAAAVPVLNRLNFDENATGVQPLLRALEEPRGSGCCCHQTTTSARFFQRALAETRTHKAPQPRVSR